MAERDEKARQQEKGPDSEGRAARETVPHAEGQDGSLKVHGDKLEKLIPKEKA